MTTSQFPGRGLAVLSATLVVADVAAIVGTFLYLLVRTDFHWSALQFELSHGFLPLAVYAIWAIGIFGTVGALMAIFLYGYRANWLWVCLTVGACAWLIFPPIHTLLGLVSLILLVRFRKAFSQHIASSS